MQKAHIANFCFMNLPLKCCAYFKSLSEPTVDDSKFAAKSDEIRLLAASKTLTSKFAILSSRCAHEVPPLCFKIQLCSKGRKEQRK